jgi:hypothetical protein
MFKTSQSDEGKRLEDIYTNEWYEALNTRALRSARVCIDHLWSYTQPSSVVDVGCGRGCWLKAWKEKGAVFLLGFDGNWNSQKDMVDSAIRFYQVDLNKRFTTGSKVDLCMALEVAEHLEPTSAEAFIKNLTDLSDMVLFGAAYTGQGGDNHINEQPHTYWAKQFSKYSFVPFDILRPALWADERIDYWYRQNTFLYVKSDTESFGKLRSKGLDPMVNNGFMDCIHPVLYSSKNVVVGFKTHLRDLLPSLVRAIKRRVS